ncbi:MAG: DUF4465 domain-containing protein [Bacteroidota bacterium]
MKKHLLLAGALLAATSFQAQTIVDFEDLTLPAVDTFYTGEDETGQYTSNGVIFENTYETTNWGYSWSGFAYSNMTDDQTAGNGNQYSAFAGSGANGSENYAIYYDGDTLIMPGIGANFGNVDITNTTYAGISMRDGDQFAKQFGSTTDANGDPDGTNGEDYFYVTVYGWDDQDELVDSTEMYLADYRFSDDTQDYILKEWTAFDWSPLNGSKYLTFKFYSSDVGEFGINTPVYFALDNLEYQENFAGLEQEQNASFSIHPNPAQDQLNIRGNKADFFILSNVGKVVMKGTAETTSVDVSALPAGLYFVTNKNKTISKKLIIR